ncbi:MAG: hypothetical protein KF723_10945 [Rhizobiaceae bacterium]|nr:hypothetical protein [Rhizobiaceae bacterium]
MKVLFGPLCQRNADFVVAGRYLVPTSLRHTFCAVLLEVVGIAGMFRPRFFALPAFAMPPAFLLNDLPEVGRKYYHEDVLKRPKSELAEMISADVETSVLPKFRALQLFPCLYEEAMGPGLEMWTHANLHFRLELASGNLDAAHMLRCWHQPRWEAPSTHPDFNFEFEAMLCQMLEVGDLKGIADVLRDRERKLFAAYKLEHLWEPTPFPLEADL